MTRLVRYRASLRLYHLAIGTEARTRQEAGEQEDYSTEKYNPLGCSTPSPEGV